METVGENIEDIFPLAPLQQGILYEAIRSPRQGFYVGQTLCRLEGKLNRDRFSAAWKDAISRHTALRSAFIWETLNEPLQVVRNAVDLEITWVDWTSQTDSDLDSWLTEDRRHGFALNEAPLMRLFVLQISEASSLLVWTSHHLILDGWSSAIVLNDVFANYSRCSLIESVEQPALAFRDYYEWTQSRDQSGALQYWHTLFKDFEAPNKLRTRCAEAPGKPSAGRREAETVLAADKEAALRDCLRKEQITLSTAIQYAWGRIVGAYSGTGDVVFGLVTVDRPGHLEGIANGVGPMLYTTPVRLQSDSLTVREALEKIQNASFERKPFEGIPLSQIQNVCGLSGDTALFESIVSIQPPPSIPLVSSGSGLEILSVRTLDKSHYPFALIVTPGDSLHLGLLYDPNRCDHDAAERMLRQLSACLAAIPDSLENSPNDLPLMSKVEADAIASFSDGGTFEPPFLMVTSAIAKMAEETPDAIAIVFAQQSVTYAELWSRTISLAQHLTHRGLGHNSRIGIFMENGIDYIIAMLAVMTSGGSYIPLDPTYPAARIDFILNDCGANLVLTHSSCAGGLQKHAHLCCDALDPMPDLSGATPPVLNGSDAAYIMYTSGSTGVPKGVIISHGNLTASTGARQVFYADNLKPNFLLLSSFAFDSSVAGIYWTLTTGGTLILTSQELRQDMHALGSEIARHQISHLLCIPSLYAQVIEYADLEDLASLDVAIVAGEAVPPDLAARHRAALPDVRLINEFGPTEATVWCTAHDITDHDGTPDVPIGRPIAGVRVHVLDSAGRPSGIGVLGELYIGGRGVASGYLNRPEDENARFIPDRFSPAENARLFRTGDLGRLREDGVIEFLGRLDRQLKIRGHRIEPSEIETVALLHPGIAEAIVFSSTSLEDHPPDLLARQLLEHYGDKAADILEEIERPANGSGTN